MTDSTPTTTPPTDTTTPPVKPGWQTTEWWLALAAVLLTALYAGGVIPTSGPITAIAAMAATVLTALGYKVSRTLVKTAGAALLAVVLTSSMLTACKDAERAKAALVDCTKTNYQAAAKEMVDCTSWSCVATVAIKFGGAVGGCAWRELVDNGTLLASGERSASPTPVSGVEAFERFRAEHAGGATFRTARGDL